MELRELQRRVEALPLRARVALAARCAERVLPLFHSWSDADPARTVHADAVKRACLVAFDYASLGVSRTKLVHPVAARAMFAAIHTCESASSAAASAAGLAARAAVFGESGELVKSASCAVSAVLTVAELAPEAVASDLATLEIRAAEGWTDDTLVFPAMFGDLWPDGAPEWARDESAAAGELAGESSITLEIEMPDDASDEEVLAAVRDVVAFANAEHRRAGGRGLKVARMDVGGEMVIDQPQEVR